MSDKAPPGTTKQASWPWPVTVLLDCVSRRDDEGRLASVHFKLSLGDGSAVVDAGTMSPESVAEGVQFTEALLNQEESDGTTTSENVAAWLWESLDDLPTAIEQL